jgi:hypothetical protein
MNRTVAIAAAVLILGLGLIVGAYFFMPAFQEKAQKQTSDAARVEGEIRVAGDNWMGYFVLRSPELRKEMRRKGWSLKWLDDNANYPERMQKLADGDLEFAVVTVDSYLLNAQKHAYPGTIVFVIDESKGGDAILADKTKVPNFEALRGRSDVRVAFTPASPSHHLAKVAADHFDLQEELLPTGDRRIGADGSAQAREKLLSGAADVAILWEPDVSLALQHENVVKLLGTEDTEKVIVDILVVNRGFAKAKPEVVKLLVNNYFRVLKRYRDQPDLLLTHVRDETDLDQATIGKMLAGFEWVNFSRNCEQWFGIAAPGGYSEDGLIDAMESAARILVHAGDFAENPIPNQDPYRLTNSEFLASLFAGGGGFTTPAGTSSAAVTSIETRFPPLDDAGWKGLRSVGNLKVKPIVFQSGTVQLDFTAKAVVDEAVRNLKHYPTFRILVEGHTDTRGDSQENQRLSQQRADQIKQYLEIAYNVDPNRVKSTGYGGERPPPKKPGESYREYRYRLSRVELALMREDF